MLFESLLLLLAAGQPAETPLALLAPAALLSSTPTPAYQPDRRAVDNWRVESALTLAMAPKSALLRAVGGDKDDVPRCVKLNNYWCVKRAGWNGEIAADADGHVAFASAEEGAAVAALLLRRYYVDYKRRSARAIVERWAPAQCSAVAGLAQPGAPASRAGMARMLPQRVVPMGLAPRGIENTLRARWLAARGRGGAGSGSGVPPRTRVDADRLVADLMPAPSIMEGMGERPRRNANLRRRQEAAPKDDLDAVAAPPVASLPPPADCSAELARINNYAAHVMEGVAKTPDEDLKLFGLDGQPTDNLAKVMINMAAVEIGPARPRAFLVASAITQLKRAGDGPAP
jgi:hypothetical protein